MQRTSITVAKTYMIVRRGAMAMVPENPQRPGSRQDRIGVSVQEVRHLMASGCSWLVMLTALQAFYSFAGYEQSQPVHWTVERKPSKGHSMLVPDSWVLWKDEDRLTITNYRAAQRGDGGLLPPGGGMIEVAQAPIEMKSAGEWAAAERRRVQLIHRGVTKCPPSFPGASNASCNEQEIRFDLAPNLYYRRCSIYFVLKGRPFRATLLYNEADAGAADKREIYRKCVESLRAIK